MIKKLIAGANIVKGEQNKKLFLSLLFQMTSDITGATDAADATDAPRFFVSNSVSSVQSASKKVPPSSLKNHIRLIRVVCGYPHFTPPVSLFFQNLFLTFVAQYH